MDLCSTTGFAKLSNKSECVKVIHVNELEYTIHKYMKIYLFSIQVADVSVWVPYSLF